jgi:TolB-like protein
MERDVDLDLLRPRFRLTSQLPRKLPSVPSAQKIIAALAFVNMSTDPDNEYFSDGIAEEIINVQFRLRRFVWMSKERYKR